MRKEKYNFYFSYLLAYNITQKSVLNCLRKKRAERDRNTVNDVN